MDSSDKPGPSFGKGTVGMGELEVRTTELAYVTAVVESETKFFAQLTKFTNKELEEHNTLINDHCMALYKKMKDSGQDLSTINPQVGDVLCARYAVDGNWYRTVVQSCDDETKECQAYFADYGNVISVAYRDLIEVTSFALSTIARPPFGFYCKIKETKSMPDKGKLLFALCDEYIMIQPKERLESNLWRVELPNVAYNQAFLSTLNQGTKAA